MTSARLNEPLLMLNTSLIASGLDLSQNGSSPSYSTNKSKMT